MNSRVSALAIVAAASAVFWLASQQLNCNGANTLKDLHKAVVYSLPVPETLPGRSPSAATALVFLDARLTETMLQQYKDAFKASDPTYQDWCSCKLSGEACGPKGSQFGQDMFMFYNLFAAKAMRGEKGFYVDSGANHWSDLSNTFFYEKCLGWEGLCVEPNAEYHQGIKDGRSCTLVPECVANASSDLGFSSAGAGSAVTADGSGPTVHCRPLAAMLAQVGSPTVDLWSLDVEGFEMTVLNSGIDFTNIHVIIIENFWISTRLSDRFLNEQGYIKFYQMDIDGLFVRFGEPVWRPSASTWASNWDLNENYRNAVRGSLANNQ